MARVLPVTIVEALTAQTTGETFLVLLEITHSRIDPIRIVNNTENITSNGDTYLRFPFRAVLPADSDDVQPVIRLIAEDAVSEVIADLRSIAGDRERALGTLRVISASDPDTYLAEFFDHEIFNAPYGTGTVNIDLGLETFLTEPFPGDSFDPFNFAAIF